MPLRKRLQVALKFLLAAVVGGLGLVAACYLRVEYAARGRIYQDPAKVAANDYALVLGTSRTGPDGGENLFFKYRIQAAASLYQAGRVNVLLVSGDNRHRTYDEPTEMKSALVERGVPGGAIVLDYAGFRTLDSVIRAKSAFGQHKFTIVSQPFHVKRALVIADHAGLQTTGFAARDVGGRHGFKVGLREVLARVKLMLDLYVLRTKPHFVT